MNDSVLYTLQYIITADLKKLYTFTVTDEVLLVLEKIKKSYWDSYLPHTFQSLKLLEESLA